MLRVIISCTGPQHCSCPGLRIEPATLSLFITCSECTKYKHGCHETNWDYGWQLNSFPSTRLSSVHVVGRVMFPITKHLSTTDRHMIRPPVNRLHNCRKLLYRTPMDVFTPQCMPTAHAPRISNHLQERPPNRPQSIRKNLSFPNSSFRKFAPTLSIGVMGKSSSANRKIRKVRRIFELVSICRKTLKPRD